MSLDFFRCVCLLLTGLCIYNCSSKSQKKTQKIQESIEICNLAKVTYTSMLQFEIKIEDREYSKDSHSDQYMIKYNRSKVTYHGPYKPCIRGRCPHKTIQFTLPKDIYAKVQSYLNHKNFTNNFTEHQPHSLGHAVNNRLVIENGNSKVTWEISGMTHLSGRDREKKTNLSSKAHQYIHNIEKLQKMLTQVAKSCAEEML